MTKTSDSQFYLGRIFDPKLGKLTDQPLFYDPADLTTHATVIGMTGSGKTGLCIIILEEAALQGIPALMIDLKGDITNVLLHFPNLSASDFQPWVNPDEARRAGKTIPQAAEEAASIWKKGLADWGISAERLERLAKSVSFAVYTPGSEAGIPLNILSSLEAPKIPWQENQEALREKISSLVTGLLGLVGLEDADPLRSRQHILLANIFEHAWSRGEDLSLGDLILRVQKPPFEKLGVFAVNTFFPEKERFELAMLLNNILASPAFQTWLQGQPLDIPALLYTPDNRPRHSVFYVAHLSDAERMFFITLLLSALETWMRSQTGTSNLRALFYFDEIFGYVPPVKNPPSKTLLLSLLKQARAFGLGLLLATQNPVDLDYKALANCGSWLIGKLQTENDKERLLEGLQGIDSKLDRAACNRLLSGLSKRVFLLHNVHTSGLQLLQTRWAMNYLAGPLSRAQIPALNQLVGAGRADVAAEPETVPATRQPTRTPSIPSQAVLPSGNLGSPTRPALAATIKEYILPNNQTAEEALQANQHMLSGKSQYIALLYRPALLAQARIRLFQRKYGLQTEVVHAVLASGVSQSGAVDWQKYLIPPIDPASLRQDVPPQSRFAPLEGLLEDAKAMAALGRDFTDWVFRNGQVKVWANEALKRYAPPQVSQAEFRTQCAEAARKERDAEYKRIEAVYDKKMQALQSKINAEQREMESEQRELSQRKIEETGTIAETAISLLVGRRRRVSTALTKHRLTQKTKDDIAESVTALEEYKRQLAQLGEERARALKEIQDKWGEIANQISEVPIMPLRKDIYLELFGVAWMPYHVITIEGKQVELPAFAF